ncbi:MAG: wax ester/triacylglycerol synthase domain-containing protein, partial [Mycobacterium sp.]
MNNTLDLFDQTFASLERAAGVLGLLQCAWVYDRAIDIDGVRRFHRHLQRGRLSRRVQRSPLKFGRDRWIASSGRSALEIVATPRPRDEFDAWLREQATTPLDFERGPEWHLAVLPFTDGGAGVSLLIPHCLTDGIGLCEALADAASGRPDPISWPDDGSRSRWQALRADARQTVRDIPGIARALVAAIGAARATAGSADSTTQPPAGPDELCSVPTTTVFVDADEWDARAHSLGGTSNSLLAGLASRLAQRMG